MGLINKFQSDLSKFFNDSARRGDSIQTQLENSDKSINPFNDESRRGDSLQTQYENSDKSINLFNDESRRGDSLQMQLENSNLSNSTQFQSTRLEDIPIDGVESFSTNQLVDSPTAEINPFSTSGLDESPTEDVGSVNFFSDDLVSGFTQFMTYPDTLYPGDGLNNSGIVDSFPNPHNYDGDTAFEIEGFTADMQKYETLYPPKDVLDSSGINSGIVDFFQSPHNYDGDTLFEIEGFTANMQKYETLYPSKDTLELSGINSGIVDFFPSPHGIGHFGVNDVPHDIEGFVADVQPLSDGFYPNTIELGSVDFFPGGNFSNNFTTSTGFTQNAEPFGESKIETEFLMVGGETSLNQDFMSNELFQSINTLGTYKGAVDFISDTDSYATGFTKNMEPLGGNKLDTQYDIDKFYTDEVGSFNVKGFSISQFVPDTFNSVAGITSYGLSPSIFTTDVEGTETPEFSVYSLGNFQPGGVAGLSYPINVDGDGNITPKPPFGKDDLINGMQSWNVGGFNIEDFTNFGDNSFGKTSYGSSDYDSFLGIPTGPDGDDVGSIKLHLNKGVFESGFSGENAYSYANIPSLKSVPRPEYTAVSGPFSTNSGFAEGDFKLGINDDGIVPRYLDTGDGREAAEGSIVRKVDGSNLRSGATSIRDLLEQDGDFDGTIFRDIKKMSGMAQTVYGTGYGDGINDGWMKGLIDTSVPIGKEFSGNSADFFIRESSGGRFLGRIAKDLVRMSKWQFSSNGLMSLAKNGVMSLFNQSEKSFQLSAPASFVTLIGNMFGLRTTSAFSSIGSLVLNAIGGKSDESMLYYESRVDRKHPSNGAVGGTFLQSLNPLPPDPIERTLTNRYGQPVYPKRGQLGGKGTRAHRLYATGLPEFDGTRFSRAVDEINVLGYGEKSSQYKDLIKFHFTDLRNNKTIIFRAFLTNIQDSVSPEWNNYRYIGRPDDVYVYKGTSRSVSFSLKVAAFTRWEMIPMWERINYLVGLNYGSYVDTKAYGEGQYFQNNPGMSSPICKMTMGDYLTEQTGYIKDFNISIPPDYPWDVIVDDGGKNVIGELPQVVDINMGFQIIPQQVPDSYGKHFGRVGTSDTIGESGLSWLPDMHDHTKNLLNEFKSKHDTYVSDKGINLVGDVENENSSNENEPDTKPGQDEANKVPT